MILTMIWSKGPKRRFSKSEKKELITLIIFNMIGPFLISLRCPKVLEERGSQGPKNEDFGKKN